MDCLTPIAWSNLCSFVFKLKKMVFEKIYKNIEKYIYSSQAIIALTSDACRSTVQRLNSYLTVQVETSWICSCMGDHVMSTWSRDEHVTARWARDRPTVSRLLQLLLKIVADFVRKGQTHDGFSDHSRWILGSLAMDSRITRRGFSDHSRWILGLLAMDSRIARDGFSDHSRWILWSLAMDSRITRDGFSDHSRWILGSHAMDSRISWHQTRN